MVHGRGKAGVVIGAPSKIQGTEMRPVADIVCSTHLTLVGFSGSVEELSLELLRKIEKTVDNLRRDEKLTRDVVSQATGLSGIIQNIGNGKNELDPDSVIVNTLSRTLAVLRKQIPVWLRKRASIDADMRLKEHNRDMLHSAYDTFLDAAVTLESAILHLKAAIVRHDMEIDNPIEGSYTDPEKLIQDLRKLRA